MSAMSDLDAQVRALAAPCRRCDTAAARVPFGDVPEFCIPCAVRLAEDTEVVVFAAGCVVCRDPDAPVVDGLTGNRYCTSDAATFLAVLFAMRAVDHALAPDLRRAAPLDGDTE